MNTITVDAYVDTSCPWCFIGKRKLEAALKLHGKDNIVVRWNGYLLNPDEPDEGKDYTETLAKLFGGEDVVRRELSRVVEMGKTVDLDFRFDLIPTVVNTLLSLCLIEWAETVELQSKVFEKVYRAHFIEGVDIGKVDILIDLGVEAGYDREDLTQKFQDKELIARTYDSIMKTREKGISMTPTFIVNEQYAVNGSYDSSTLADLFDRLS